VPPGLTAKRQVDRLVENLHGMPSRAGMGSAADVPTLGKIVPFPRPSAKLAGEPSIVRLDDKGRFVLTGVTSRLGWDLGDLEVVGTESTDWIVLASVGAATVRRKVARLNAGDRITLPHVLCHRAGLDAGGRAFVLELTEHGLLAVTSPARILTGAPLAIAEAPQRAGSCRRSTNGRNHD
jgi:hypothetical protein